jgi:three-Cys-motif partner protein
MAQPEETLWDSEPRTLLKHHVYRWYLDCWMGKVCQNFRHSAVVDAFAGPGVYKDGLDGSSIVIANTFLNHSRRERFGVMRLLCAEKRQDRRDHLEILINQLPRVPKLVPQVLTAGTAADRFVELNAAAHGGDRRTPTLR